MARRSRTVLVRGSKKGTFWAGSARDTDRTVLAAGTTVLDQTGVLGSFIDLTIVRTRGVLWVGSDQVAAAETPFGALGMLVTTPEAITAGAASLPAPYTDSDNDRFFVHQYFVTHLQFSSGVGFNPQGFTGFPFDSKAMRCVD